MVCIHCGAKTHVFNSRLQHRKNQIWRRRQCSKCEAIFTTEETPHYGSIWIVQKPNDGLEPFSRDKLLLSLYKSCQHRSTALVDAAELVDTIIRRVSEQVENGRIWYGSIAQVTIVILRRFDKAASVHYQANHE